MTAALTLEQRLRDVFQRTLALAPGTNIDKLEYRRESRWDSVAHLQLIVELEQEFQITIGNEDVLHMTSFANILRILQR
jgi:acyl carrier protein